MAKEIKRTEIGKKIRERRKALHITQVQIAEMLGIKRVTYARYETSGNPPIAILTKIAQILGMTTDEILTDEAPTYSGTVNEGRNQLLSFSSPSGYNTEDKPSFTMEELDILIKIIDLPTKKREELVAYISEIVNENIENN